MFKGYLAAEELTDKEYIMYIYFVVIAQEIFLS